MGKFRQRVAAYYDIIVEAEDMYKADDIIADMPQDEFFKRASLLELATYDTDEFPEEVG